MNLFLVIGIAVVALFLLGILYGVLFDPARIDEEEDDEVAHESPAEREGFLRSHRRSAADWDDRVTEHSKADIGEGGNEINDL